MSKYKIENGNLYISEDGINWGDPIDLDSLGDDYDIPGLGLAKRLVINGANPDARYGPYESLDEFYKKMAYSMYSISSGMTIALTEDGKNVEYWNPYKEDINKFVKKIPLVFQLNEGSLEVSYDNGETWESLGSLKGDQGESGKSAYEIAQDNGFSGTEEDWLESLKGEKGDKLTFDDLSDEEKESLKGEKGDKLTFDDLSDEEKESLKGEKGDKLTFDDLSDEEKESLKGEKGDKLTFDDLSDEEKESLKGEKGDTPEITIGANGNWEIDGVDTEVSAKGERGDDGLTPKFQIVGGNLQVTYQDGEITEDDWANLGSIKGEDGVTPTISIDNDGFWVINGDKTNVNAKGEGGGGCSCGVTQDMIDYLNSVLNYTYTFSASISADPATIDLPTTTTKVTFTINPSCSKSSQATGSSKIAITETTVTTEGWTLNSKTGKYEKVVDITSSDLLKSSISSGAAEMNLKAKDGESVKSKTGVKASAKSVTLTKPWFIFSNNKNFEGTEENPIEAVIVETLEKYINEEEPSLLSGRAARKDTEDTTSIKNEGSNIWFAIPHNRELKGVTQLGNSILDDKTAITPSYTVTTSIGEYKLYLSSGALTWHENPAGSTKFKLVID